MSPAKTLFNPCKAKLQPYRFKPTYRIWNSKDLFLRLPSKITFKDTFSTNPSENLLLWSVWWISKKTITKKATVREIQKAQLPMNQLSNRIIRKRIVSIEKRISASTCFPRQSIYPKLKITALATKKYSLERAFKSTKDRSKNFAQKEPPLDNQNLSKSQSLPICCL